MQQRRSHPFFSRIGCGSAVLLVMVLMLILYFRGGGPFSPGDLTAAQSMGESLGGFQTHAEFAAECSLCHSPWRGPAAERCEACHVSIAQERASQDGLHALLPDVERCHTCHTDHKGRMASIIQIDEAQFDHQRLTGYSLTEHPLDFSGAPMECSACHAGGRYSPGQVVCIDCHRQAEAVFMDEHVLVFGEACLDCHDGSGQLVDFDHEQVFPLAGAHADVDCQECHVDRQFAGTPRECVACHEEPVVHAGLFGLDCARCHTETAWTPAQLTAHTFPLDHGSSVDLACETCHTDSYTTYTCYNCHEHTPAGIREEHVDEGINDFEDCVACHPTGREDEAEDD